MAKPKKTKELPEILPCKCGDIGVTLRAHGGRWAVYCLNPACACYVRNHNTEAQAVEAWNAKVREATTT